MVAAETILREENVLNLTDLWSIFTTGTERSSRFGVFHTLDSLCGEKNNLFPVGTLSWQRDSKLGDLVLGWNSRTFFLINFKRGKGSTATGSQVDQHMRHNIVKWMRNKGVLLPVGSNSCLRGDEGFSCLFVLSVGSLLRIFGVLKRQKPPKQKCHCSRGEIEEWEDGRVLTINAAWEKKHFIYYSITSVHPWTLSWFQD